MSELVCQHCETKNAPEAELCVACGQPLVVDSDAQRDEAGTGPMEREEVERWVRQLPDSALLDADSLAHDDESLPAWLQAVRAHADKLTSQEADELLDFLADLEPGDQGQGNKAPEDAADQAKMTAELPGWVAALLPKEEWPDTDAANSLAEHFAEAEAEDEERLPSTAPLSQTEPLAESRELEGIPEMLAGDKLPEWLAAETEGEEQIADEEPPGWPGRTLRPGTAGVVMPEPESLVTGEPEPEMDAETIDSVLDEVEAATEAERQAPQPADDLTGFSDWMDPAQTAALEETLEEMLDLPEAETSEGRVGQWLDILEGMPGRPQTDEAEAALSDSEVDDVEIPDWMQAMRAEDTTRLRDPAELGPPEESGPLAGLRGILPAATIALSAGVDRGAGQLTMTKEQRQQAALLRRLTAAAPDTAAPRTTSDDPFLLGRLVLGAALLLVILLGVLAPDLADLLPQASERELPPAAAGAREAIAASAGGTALVAFDYTPAMAGELDLVAGVLLADLAANDVAVLSVSQVAAGVPVAERAKAASEGLSGSSIGYLPGEASGLRALGTCLERRCDDLAGRRLSLETQTALTEVNLIVVLAGDRDSLAGWLEQVGARNDVDIVAGVTQALAPVAGPYLQSKQLAGVVAGLPDSLAYDQTAPATVEQLAGLALAQWLAIGVILAGIIYFGFVAPAASAVGQVTRK